MNTVPLRENLPGLLDELRRLPAETPWVEFKHNNAHPEEIGEYISALANAAALEGKVCGYMVWGIEDGSRKVVGTSFTPALLKIGNEELENWLRRLLALGIYFQFHEVSIGGHCVVVLEVPRVFYHPIRFKDQAFIRVGSYKKKLKDFPDLERSLWHILDESPFESLIAAADVSETQVLDLLNYPSYFHLLALPLPRNAEAILQALAGDAMIVRNEAGTWNITNLGAILFAHKLSDFRALQRKSLRVITYDGNGRLLTTREHTASAGYAIGFEGMIAYINGIVPSNEVVGQALRRSVPMYPELAIRELAANALIHQDFSITGAGPMIEIFNDRMEVSNPGIPLVQTERFLDAAPRSRNESLASFMRRIGVCEERGSGIDKVVWQTELHQLPAPAFEVNNSTMVARLFGHRPLSKMEKDDRIRACYLHACLRYVSLDFMTNSSLRERFGIEPRNSATASRLIREALDADMIRPYDDTASRRFIKYVPYWA